MGKQQKKSKKSGGKKPVEPLAALYNLDAGTERGDAVRAVLAEVGLRVRTVTYEHLGDPVGAIAGITGFRPARTPFDGDAPKVEFMLLANVPSKLLNELLAAMREADAVVDCKAQVTQYNRMWPFATLVAQVAKEHETMTGSAPKEAEQA